MADRRAFLEAIASNLDDDAPRLVFADWLEEHGDEHDRARAAFIRVQCELARLPAGDPRREDLARREEELLAGHGMAWVAPLGPGRAAEYWLGRLPATTSSPGQRPWRRGFPRWPRFFVQDYLGEAEKLLAREVVQDVILELNLDRDRPGTEEDAWVERLAASPRLGLAGALHGPSSGFGPRRFSILLRSPHLARLCEIDLFEDLIGLEGIRALVESPAPFGLRRLCLNGAISLDEDEETAEAVEAVRLLAGSPKLAGLEYLGLYYNGLGEGSVAALVASPHLSRSLALEFEEEEELAAPLRDSLRRRFQLR
jgi:uncharacterized protein (TIGR02996 family)